MFQGRMLVCENLTVKSKTVLSSCNPWPGKGRLSAGSLVLQRVINLPLSPLFRQPCQPAQTGIKPLPFTPKQLQSL